ncbi:MAG TPA: hypothetical protein VMR59_04670 [Patescibacteria group bacterium]|jgi:hypothetical protein|nr:hypothetical protein [Patescibacteria group bacterium]
MGVEGGSQGYGEEDGGGDNSPTATHYFLEIVQEVVASLDSDTKWDQGVHEGNALIAAYGLVRTVMPSELPQFGSALTDLSTKHPESLLVVTGAYKLIREAYSVEQGLSSREVRRLLGLPTKGRIFPTQADKSNSTR